MNKSRERMGSTLLLAYASTGLSQVANQGFFFILLRYLPVESVGIYSWAVAVATIYTYIMDLGLSSFLVGELTQNTYRLRTLLQAVLLLRLPVLALGGLLLAGWAALSEPSRPELTALGLLTLTYVMQMIDGAVVPWFQAARRQNAANLLALVVPLGRLACIVGLLAATRTMTLAQVVWISLLTQVAGTLVLVFAARRSQGPAPVESGGVRQLLSHFRQRGPGLALMYCLNVLQARLDWILVAALVSHVALASYSVANKVIEVAMLMAAIWARTSFPWLTRSDAQSPEVQHQLGVLRRLFIVSTGLCTVVLFFGAPILIELFFGSKYAETRVPLALLTLATAIFMQNQYFLYDLLSSGLEKTYTTIIVAASLGQVLLNCWLLPRIGVVGAALTLVITGVAMHAGQVALLVRAGKLGCDEVVRMEAFALALTGGLAVAWWLDASRLAAGVALLACAGFFGLRVILNASDRAHLAERWNQVRMRFRGKAAGI